VWGSMRVAWWVPLGLALVAAPALSQLRLGELSTHLDGTIAPGYTADYSNLTGSDHSWALGGTANVSGSFYNPNFLSFNVGLYLNQSRANSSFQSISNASGVTATTNIFAGSHFPGSISYSKAWNTEGNYAVPGLANYVTHGNNDAFGVNWNENIPGAPSFSVGYAKGDSDYSVYATNEGGNVQFHTLNLHSSYSLAGFGMGGFYSSGDSHALIPEVASNQTAEETDSDNSAYGFNASHPLPFHGSASASYNHSYWDTDYLGTSSTGSIDIVAGLAAVHPTEKLSFTGSANYSNNLTGQIIQSVLAAGGTAGALTSNEPSDSLDLQGVGSYAPMPNLQTSAYIERRTQDFLGSSYGVTSYGQAGSYSHEFLDGTMNASLTVTENVPDKNGAQTVGISTTENYSTEFRGWHMNGAFSYAQNVETLLVTYMNSFYNYSGNVRRRWGNLSITGGAGASHTALTQQAGTASGSESVNGSFSYAHWITANSTYAHASGQALATGSGLVPVPVPVPVLPSNLVSLYGGNSYSLGLSSTPLKKLMLTASYARSSSNTSSDSVASTNQNNQFSAIVQYQVRKLSVVSGFARLEQGFTGSTTPPEVVSSFYIGVSRWFNFF